VIWKSYYNVVPAPLVSHVLVLKKRCGKSCSRKGRDCTYIKGNIYVVLYDTNIP